ncbi:uncharacterized protein LOC124271222 [Haliotis rubra]|uniref:uncharacterized protein LOC124271222 n=1 Tax=Haliotis rubra TaxID=36100 RepID=UPI001EE5F3E9|nr:uncharacterized protein LOC124271222 [Haliotis rubra]
MDVQRRAAVVLTLELEYQHQLLITIRRLFRRRRRRAPRWWVRPWLTPDRRLEYSHYNRLMQELRMEDEKAFANYVRMPPHMFDELLNRIIPVIQRRDTHRETSPRCPRMKLAMTLRHLATGDRYHTIQYDFRCGYSTVVWIVQEVCQAIIQELKDEVMLLPRTQEDCKDIAQQFQDRWNVPHALGALDGKHIAIRKPHNSGSVFFNYKELKECIGDNTINFPDSDRLPNDDRDTAYYILGDDAFPLRTFLMKPYGRRGLDNDMLVANYRLSRGRRVVENGFGILANRWRCFLGTLEHGPDVVRLLVEAGVILHNLLRIRFPATGNADVDREDEDHTNIPGAWRADQQVEEIPQF